MVCCIRRVGKEMGSVCVGDLLEVHGYVKVKQRDHELFVDVTHSKLGSVSKC